VASSSVLNLVVKKVDAGTFTPAELATLANNTKRALMEMGLWQRAEQVPDRQLVPTPLREELARLLPGAEATA